MVDVELVAPGPGFFAVKWDLASNFENNADVSNLRFEFGMRAEGATDSVISLSNFTDDPSSVAGAEVREFTTGSPGLNPATDSPGTLSAWMKWDVFVRGVYTCNNTEVVGNWLKADGSPVLAGTVPEPVIISSVGTPAGETLRVTWDVSVINQAPAAGVVNYVFDPRPEGLTFEVALLRDDGAIDPAPLADFPQVNASRPGFMFGVQNIQGLADNDALWRTSKAVTPIQGTCAGPLTDSDRTCDIEGLIAGESYFVGVRAGNSLGFGPWGTLFVSAPGSMVGDPGIAQAFVPTVLPPSTPSITNVSAGVESAEVTVDRGSSGGPPASFVVTASPGGATCTVTGTSGSCTVSGLAGGVAHTFTAVATNATGSSSATSASTAVTPTAANSNQGGSNQGSANQGSQSGQGTGSRPTGNASGATSVSPSTQTQAPGSAVSAIPSRPSTPALTPSPQTPGQAPPASGLSAAQSGPLATVGGQVVTVESTATSPTQLALQVGKVSLGMSVVTGSGTVGSNGSGANGSDALGIQLANGASTTFEGGGLTPGSAVQVVLPLGGDDSAVLAVLEVAEDGTFSGEAAFGTTPDGDPLPIGVRVVQLFTVDEDGNDVVIEVAVTIGQPDPAPAINRADGSVPALTPGEALGTSAGLPQVIEVRAIEEQKRAVVDGGDWSMAVDVASSTGGVQSVDSGAQLTLVRDESAMVSGSGFMAGTRADVWLFSEPTLLGTVTVDENGEFVGEVTINGIVIPAGEHTLQLQGVGQDGYVKATSLGVAVDDVTAPAPADTTASSLWMLLLAITGLAILLIAVFIVAVRRKMQNQ